ncbi:hypothetical protein ABZU86_22685 [Streptomyces sp. NPDC005271]|uniref:hypothetical protein n=1 Tax=unclassified Streptomyces TaxID=2593676 RepID=UPI0033A2C1EF
MRITRRAGGGMAALILGMALAAIPTQALAAPVPCNVPALQAAIVAANGSPNGGTIDLAPNCVYSVTDAEAIGDNAMPIITNNITINGFNSTIQRDPAAATNFRIFQVDGSTGRLTLNRVTVRNGHSVDGGGIRVNPGGTLILNAATDVRENEADGIGGGILNDGTVFLNPGSRVTDNEAGAGGGGIINRAALTARSATVSENRGASGGGIFNTTTGTLDLRTSTVSLNRATVDNGGGIVNGNEATLTSTVVSGNTAVNRAGGFFNFSFASATINSGRISDNEADNLGGGLYNAGTLNVNQTTVRANHVTVPAATSHGGGLYNETGTTTFTSSNVYQNTVAPPGDGGGIYEEPGSTVTLVTSSVFSNTPDNCRPPGAVPGCSG